MTAAITIHFKNPKLTSACIDSLLADGWAPILVWDNSEDAGGSLQDLQTRYAAEPRVVLVTNPRNLGFGKGMNAALAALGRYGYAGPVLLVNNDARVQPGMRLALEARLTHTNTPMLIAPRLMQDGQEQGWLYYQPWLALVTKRPVWGSFAYLSGCCLLVKRPDSGIWAGLWTPPMFDDAAALEAAVGRLGTGPAQALPSFVHVLTHLDWTLHPCRIELGAALQACEPGQDLPPAPLPELAPGRWWRHDELATIGLPAPLRRLIQPPTQPPTMP